MQINDDDKRLVALALKTPEQGFRRLMTLYREPLYWHIRRLVVGHEDAQDALQETFVRTFRSLKQFKGDCSLRSWIYRIATNEALRILSRRKTIQFSLDDSPAEVNAMKADDYVDFSDLEAVKLQKAILSLPTKQQLAFNLRYYDELSYEEIAGIAGCSQQSAKANFHFAKEKIVKYMNENE